MAGAEGFIYSVPSYPSFALAPSSSLSSLSLIHFCAAATVSILVVSRSLLLSSAHSSHIHFIDTIHNVRLVRLSFHPQHPHTTRPSSKTPFRFDKQPQLPLRTKHHRNREPWILKVPEFPQKISTFFDIHHTSSSHPPSRDTQTLPRSLSPTTAPTMRLLSPHTLLTLLLPALALAQSPTFTSTTTSTTTITRTLIVAGVTETHTYTSVIPTPSSSNPSASASASSAALGSPASKAILASSSSKRASVASSTAAQAGTSTETALNEATMKPYSYLGGAKGAREVSWGWVVGAVGMAGMTLVW